MNDFSKSNESPREIRKERFEFELTVNGNIIIRRYFKINSFNERSIYSTELADTVRNCAELIDNNLKAKTEIYIRHMTPLIFGSEDEMRAWFKNERNLIDVRYGAWATVRGKGGHDYVWLGGDRFKDEGPRVDYNEFVDKPEENQPVTFRFSVIDNGYDFIRHPAGRVIGSAIWDGSGYPKFIRNGVDISNGWMRGKNKYEDMDISKLSHEMSLYYWCNKDQPDLVPVIIREICEACSEPDRTLYTTKMEYGDTVYVNTPDYPGPKPEYPYKKVEPSKKRRG